MERQGAASFVLMNIVLLAAGVSFILVVFDLQRLAFIFEFGVLVLFLAFLALGMVAVYRDKPFGWVVIAATLMLMLLDLFFVFLFTARFEWSNAVCLIFSLVGIIVSLINMHGIGDFRKHGIEKAGQYYSPDKVEPRENMIEKLEESKEEIKKEVKEEVKEELRQEISGKNIEKKFVPGKYIASRKANKYHSPKCDWANRIKKGNEVWFGSKEEAEAQGFEADGCV